VFDTNVCLNNEYIYTYIYIYTYVLLQVGYIEANDVFKAEKSAFKECVFLHLSTFPVIVLLGNMRRQSVKHTPLPVVRIKHFFRGLLFSMYVHLFPSRFPAKIACVFHILRE
jgi:hypothetical protein